MLLWSFSMPPLSLLPSPSIFLSHAGKSNSPKCLTCLIFFFKFLNRTGLADAAYYNLNASNVVESYFDTKKKYLIAIGSLLVVVTSLAFIRSFAILGVRCLPLFSNRDFLDPHQLRSTSLQCNATSSDGYTNAIFPFPHSRSNYESICQGHGSGG